MPMKSTDDGPENEVEEALHANERLLRLFVEHSPAAIAMFDHEMRCIAANRSFLKDYHQDDQNIIGRSYYDMFPDIPER